MTRWMDQDVLADPRFPLPDGVADDVSPQEALLAAIPHRSFAEIEPMRDGVERRIGAHDAFEAGRREIDVHASPCRRLQPSADVTRDTRRRAAARASERAGLAGAGDASR